MQERRLLATGYWLLAWAQRKRHDYNYNDSCWFPSCEVLTPCTTGRSESQHGGLYTQKEERVLHSERGEGSTLSKRRRLCHNEGRELCHREGRGLCF